MSSNLYYENHLNASEAKWFAVYSAFKKEKYAQKLLKQKGIETYLPIQTVTRRYTRKIKTIHLPLIPCYIFVKIVKNEYVSVLETEYILNFVKFSKNLISIPEAEIQLLQKILGEGVLVSVEKSGFYEGDLVKINSGNLTGLQGKLISFQGKERVIVELEHLGYSLLIDINKQLLTKAQPALAS